MKRLVCIIPAFLAGLLPVLPLRAFVPCHDLSAAQPTNTTFSVQGPAFGIRRSFDPAGRLASVTASAGHSAAPFSLTYSPHDGGLAAVSNAVLSETRARDLLGNVTNITYRNASGTTVGQFRYRYDDTGLVTQKVATVGPASPPVTNAYTYDMLGRLTAADGVAYAYDAAGNRLDNGTYTHNRLDGVLHDAAGNVTRIVSASSVRELTWNTQNQLVSVTTNGIPAESYTYDPLGRRLSTTDTSGTVYHVYDGDHCAADLDATGAPLRTYTWGPGIDNLLAVTVFSPASTNTFYAIKDHLGTVHALVDASGQLAAQFTYDAWGSVQSATGNGQLARSNRFLFQGREYSWATGLYNFRARWYNPEWGRWLSPDPIGIEGGLNLYAFCHNNPVTSVDPHGNTPLITGAIGAGVGAVTSGALALYRGNSWSQVGYAAARGALAGGVAGLTMGLGGGVIAGVFGGGWLGGAAAGMAAGATANVAVQGLDLATGQSCEFDWGEYGISVGLGGLFGAAFARPYTAPNQQVSSWASADTVPDLNPGRWVMVGPPSVGNYLRTVGPAMRGYPIGNSVSDTVSSGNLSYPPGLTGNFAGTLGQRIIH